MNRTANIKKGNQIQYVIVAIFLMVVSIIAIIIPVELCKDFSADKEFYLAGEKVDGVVVDFKRYAGEGSVTRFVVHLVVKYVDSDGTEYKLDYRENGLQRASEERVKQEIGTTRPLIIDKAGKCIRGDHNEGYYNRAIAICITIIVVGSLLLIVNLLWLIRTTKSIILKKRNKKGN